MNSVIIKPVITEKSMNDVGQNKYAFVVARHAKKADIKKAVAKLFNVKVTGVLTTVVKGKTKRTGSRRVESVVSSVKKAIVMLKAGEKIGLFESNK